MSEKKPNMGPLYGAAYGFNTDRRVKPVHFATGFFLSLLGKQNRTELLNNVVAFTDGKDHRGAYALPALHEKLKTEGKVGSRITRKEVHTLRKHLRSIINNDEAVFPIYGEKEFGCDYTTASDQILTSTRDNDGFTGFFTYSILQATAEGRKVLDFARQWVTQPDAPLKQCFQPLIANEPEAAEMEDRYAAKIGELSLQRIKSIAQKMSNQTKCLLCLCDNVQALTASETRLRCLIIGLCLWLFRYLMKEGASGDDAFILLADLTGDASTRMRAQSRWSYGRLREALIESFHDFAAIGRFDECEDAWEHIESFLEGRPKFEEFYGTIALRSGLAQPRASRVPAKHFEPQADTLRILVWSVLPHTSQMLSLLELLDRFHSAWGLVFGGRSSDAKLLRDLGYTGLDQDHDLTPNTSALVDLLAELGLATRLSDGLVMCHSEPRFV